MTEQTTSQNEAETLSFSEICAAQRLWNSSPGIRERFGYDFNQYLHGCKDGLVLGLHEFTLED